MDIARKRRLLCALIALLCALLAAVVAVAVYHGLYSKSGSMSDAQIARLVRDKGELLEDVMGQISRLEQPVDCISHSKYDDSEISPAVTGLYVIYQDGESERFNSAATGRLFRWHHVRAILPRAGAVYFRCDGEGGFYWSENGQAVETSDRAIVGHWFYYDRQEL